MALCTCNGDRFLREQLTSIARQNRLPDELIVCDDNSTDDTRDLVRAFAATAPFSVRVEVNATRLGSTANFAQAIALCRGDLIVLADQDDVWRPDKLERLEKILAPPSAAALAFSDALMVDEQQRPLGFTLWDAIDFREREQRQFENGQAFSCLLRRYRVTGATLAFRSSYRDLILPIPPVWMHDAWIALLLAAVAPCQLIAEPLIQYRQHPQQQLGERKRGLFAQYQVARQMGRTAFQQLVEQFHQALARLRGWPGVPAENLRALTQKVHHCEQRLRMRQRGAWRLPTILREWWRGHYTRYSRGWKALAQDLFLP